MPIKFIDLFSGCGGLTEAFLNNKKFIPLKIIDHDKFCYETTIYRLKQLGFKNFNNIAQLKDISDPKTIKENAKKFQKEIFKILDKEKTKVVFNSDWLGKLKGLDLIELASHYTVARMLERDDFDKRFKIEKKPTAKLEVLVFCNPTNNPVIIYSVNSPGAE